jgi:hypothetical protein
MTPVPLLTLFAPESYLLQLWFLEQCEGWHLTR